ncbi:MAG: hypothetical protein HOW97_18730 [Catenulispora sp.]|nr:hypothetical protein [Catenulispora sp.]
MRRGRRALTGLAGLATGLTAMGALAVAGAGPAAADDSSGPVATAPSAPATQTVNGVAANGVRLTLTLPQQFPVDLPGQELAPREVDVTVKDTTGQGYTGEADTTFTAVGSGVDRMPLRIDRYDPDSGGWRPVTVSPDAGASLKVTTGVAVPADGTQDVRLRVSPGTTLLDGVKVSAVANGATVVGSAPVTEPAFSSSGLTGSVKAGTPEVVTGRLTNPTDVDYAHVPVKLYLKACSGQTGLCVQPADVKLEAKVGGQWQQVPATADPSVVGGVSGTVFPDLSLAAGESVDLTARMTLNSGSATVSPVPLGFGPMGLTIAGKDATGGTLTVQPAAPTPTPTPATSSSSTPTATPSTSDSSSETAASPSGTPSATPATAATPQTQTQTPATAPTGEAVAASTPGAPGSGSATILVAAGLLAVCLALLLVWALIKRRERTAAALRAGGPDLGHDLGHDGGHDHGHGGAV